MNFTANEAGVVCMKDWHDSRHSVDDLVESHWMRHEMAFSLYGICKFKGGSGGDPSTFLENSRLQPRHFLIRLFISFTINGTSDSLHGEDDWGCD